MLNSYSTKKIVTIGILIALEIICTRFLSINTPIIRIGFGFVPIACIAMLFGPMSAAIGAAIADILGTIAFSSFAYFPGYTLTAVLTGLAYGYFLYKKPVTFKNILFAVLIVTIILDLGLDTYWIKVTMQKAYIALVPIRLAKTILVIPIQIIIISVISKLPQIRNFKY